MVTKVPRWAFEKLPGTDGRLAERLAVPFGLVDSGVTPATAGSFDVPVALRFPDFGALVRSVLA